MKKAIRCCISCILPCGALDVIRIVHANGRVEEISGSIRACEVMKAYPKHVLKKTSSSSFEGGANGEMQPRIVILPPDAGLERGKIYFLMPAPVVPYPPPLKSARRRLGSAESINNNKMRPVNKAEVEMSKHERRRSTTADQYLSELLREEKLSRRRGRVGVWRPHLESIRESP